MMTIEEFIGIIKTAFTVCLILLDLALLILTILIHRMGTIRKWELEEQKEMEEKQDGE